MMDVDSPLSMHMQQHAHSSHRQAPRATSDDASSAASSAPSDAAAAILNREGFKVDTLSDAPSTCLAMAVRVRAPSAQIGAALAAGCSMAAAAQANHNQQQQPSPDESQQPVTNDQTSALAPAVTQPFVFCEATRLATVLRYAICDTPREAQFDSITEAASLICHTSAALITIVDKDSAWFKSNRGFGDARSTRREWSVCEHVIRTNEMLVVEDLARDERFKNNPFVRDPPHMRFYAGTPLTDPESGQALGALCVVDFQPRQLNELQRCALNLLARQVMAACDSRLRILKLQEALQQLEETRGALAASEEQAKRAQKQAEQANMAKSEFLANMSHEIRTPLNGVLGTASLLAETTRLDGEQKDYVRVIQSSGEHLLIVLNDILDFSKFESGKLEIDTGVVDTTNVLEQAIELSFRSKPNLELVYEIAENVPKAILADATRLRQIVANLISNAAKFTNHGEVKIRVEVMTAREIEEAQRPSDHVAAAAAAAAAAVAGKGASINQRIRTNRDFDDEPPAPASSSQNHNLLLAPSSGSSSVAEDEAGHSDSTITTTASGSQRKKRRLHNDMSILPAGGASSSQLPPRSPGESSDIAVQLAAGMASSAAAAAAAISSASTVAAASASSLTSANCATHCSVPSRPSSSASFRSLAEDPDSILLVWSVSDTGIGIDSSKIHKLFSAFTQLDISITREYGGTGLGLAISARLAQLMGGSMWVKSEVGKGSTFYFSIRTKSQHPALLMSHTPTPAEEMHDAPISHNSSTQQQLVPHPSSSQLPSLKPLHPLAAHFSAWGELDQHPRVAKFIEGRTHALVVEPNQALLRSLSMQLRRWGLTPLAYTSISEAQKAMQEGNHIREHRLAAIILSQPPPPLGTELRLSPTPADGVPNSSSSNITVPCSLIQQLRIADSQLNARAVRPDCHCAAASGGGCVSSSSTTFEYKIPAIILLPTLTEEEQVAALATPRPTAPPINRAECSKNCNILRKPVLLTQLKKKLDKAFRISLFGAGGATAPVASAMAKAHQPQANGNDGSMLLAATAALVAATTATSAAAAAFANAAASSSAFSVPQQQQQPSLPSASPRSPIAASGSPNSSSPTSSPMASPGGSSSSSSNGSSGSGGHAVSSLRVLLVEDNSTNMKLTVRMLRSLGVTEIDQAWNGQEAVDKVVNQGGTYDVILLDNQMPVLSGPQACRIICAYYRKIEAAVASAAASQSQSSGASSSSAPHAPIIIALTASCMESDREHALATGHNDFLSKPLSLPVLRQKLQHWAVRIQERNNNNSGQAAAASTRNGAPATVAMTD